MDEATWLTSTDPAAMLRWLFAGRPGGEQAGANHPLVPCPVVVSDQQLQQFKAAVIGRVKMADLMVLAPEPPPWGFWYDRQLQLEPVECAALLRCVAGNPFCPVLLAPPEPADPFAALDVLRHESNRSPGVEYLPRSVATPAITRMARAIQDDRDHAALPLLADALEGEGCGLVDLLGHLHAAGPHALPGCHVIRCILGEED